MNFLPVEPLAPCPSTNILITRSSARGGTVVAAFIALVFVGDIWLVKLTLPLSMLLLPLIFVAFRPYKSRSFPVGMFLLLGLIAIAALQIATGMSLDVKADTALWRPTLYAVATIFCLSAVALPDEQLKRAIFVGGFATGAIMLAMILFASSNLFLVPGQNVSQVAAKFQAEGHAGVATQFSPELSAGSQAFYGLKNKARNLLGGSNYIAVFLVFVFTVAIFTRSRIVAILMAGLAIMTMSRLGLLCLAGVIGSYFVHRRGVSAARISTAILAAGAIGMVAFYLVGPQLATVAESVSVRLNFVRSAVDIAAIHPLLGAPRSLVLDQNDLNIVWSPHSSGLQLAVYFGVIGAALYAAYVWFVFRSLARVSNSSDLWAGISVGLSIAFAWSLLEIIVITPAFEILVAALYALVSKKLSSYSSPSAAGTHPCSRLSG